MVIRAFARLVRPLIRRVQVDGLSMVPSYGPGEYVWAVRRWRPLRPGLVVVARVPNRHRLEVVKRVATMDTGGVWLIGDNREVSQDSRHWGPVSAGSIRWVVFPQRAASSS